MAGMTDAARERNVNLVCYIAGVAGEHKTMHFDTLSSFVKELIDPLRCDGLILSNTFADFTKGPSFAAFWPIFRLCPSPASPPSTPAFPALEWTMFRRYVLFGPSDRTSQLPPYRHHLWPPYASRGRRTLSSLLRSAGRVWVGA
jgi:hypothetical protein